MKRICAMAAAAFLAGCEGQAESIATLYCDCFHCSDTLEDVVVTYMESIADTAAVYGCSDDFEKLADCIEDEAECDEDHAQLKTTDNGDCSGSTDLLVSCATDADCSGVGPIGSASCEAGSCHSKSCKGAEGVACTSDDDCPGEDRCDSEDEALRTCIGDAAEDPSLGDVNLLELD